MLTNGQTELFDHIKVLAQRQNDLEATLAASDHEEEDDPPQVVRFREPQNTPPLFPLPSLLGDQSQRQREPQVPDNPPLSPQHMSVSDTENLQRQFILTEQIHNQYVTDTAWNC